jgi:hypothetical protein
VTAVLVKLAARHDCVAVIASPPCKSFSALQHNSVAGSGDVCRDLDSPHGILVSGDVHPRAAAGNLVLCNCLRIIRTALAHDAAFILKSPVSRASGSPYAIGGRETHAITRRYLKVREYEADGIVTVRRVATQDNTADIFTKPLSLGSFLKHRCSLMP